MGACVSRARGGPRGAVGSGRDRLRAIVSSISARERPPATFQLAGGPDIWRLPTGTGPRGINATLGKGHPRPRRRSKPL